MGKNRDRNDPQLAKQVSELLLKELTGNEYSGQKTRIALAKRILRKAERKLSQ
ncbi:hypothetical protein [Vibrio quintilis]|uniref:hypothetical protein n=1 Tax=Vibrio quintilis TaxID=1117707 RepID=UPI0013563B5F|nr:hypothetical protein [Vibrio quintilis]